MQNGYAYPIIGTESFSRRYDRYLTVAGQKNYTPRTVSCAKPDDAGASSIDSILEQDSLALMDKVVNTAFSIVYRLRIYNDINKSLEYNWLKTKSQISQLYEWIPGTNMNVERRKSMLQKELHALDKQRLEEKINCWKDMSQPVNYFVEFFHQSQELKQDRKLLE